MADGSTCGTCHVPMTSGKVRISWVFCKQTPLTTSCLQHRILERMTKPSSGTSCAQTPDGRATRHALITWVGPRRLCFQGIPMRRHSYCLKLRTRWRSSRGRISTSYIIMEVSLKRKRMGWFTGDYGIWMKKISALNRWCYWKLKINSVVHQ